jgi:hypothetical protein
VTSSGLSPEQEARLYATIDALPPLTDTELDALAEVLADARLRFGHRHLEAS